MCKFHSSILCTTNSRELSLIPFYICCQMFNYSANVHFRGVSSFYELICEISNEVITILCKLTLTFNSVFFNLSVKSEMKSAFSTLKLDVYIFILIFKMYLFYYWLCHSAIYNNQISVSSDYKSLIFLSVT